MVRENDASRNGPSRLQKFFTRLQQWADAGWSGTVVFAWGLLQGCVFPGLADVFFLPLALARPQRAYALALIATAGTLIGSLLLYAAGESVLSMLDAPLAEWLGITAEHGSTRTVRHFRPRPGRPGAIRSGGHR